jgi:hypothetical protein
MRALCLSTVPASENVLFREAVFGDFRSNVIDDGLNFGCLRCRIARPRVRLTVAFKCRCSLGCFRSKTLAGLIPYLRILSATGSQGVTPSYVRPQSKIYGQPDFCKRVGVDVNWACANLSGVVVGTELPPHDESRAGQTSKNPQHSDAVLFARFLARPLSRLCLHVSRVAKPGREYKGMSGAERQAAATA